MLPVRSVPAVSPRPTIRVGRRARPAVIVEPYLWIAPALFVFFVFAQLPLLVEFVLSLYSTDGLGRTDFVGLRNYADLAFDHAAWTAIAHNVIYAVVTVSLKLAVALGLALALNTAIAGRIVFRTVLFLPVVLSFVAVGTIWTLIYNFDDGILNQILRRAGLGAFAYDWLGDARLAFGAVMTVDVWKWFGFHLVIYLAGLQSVPSELHEAAAVDGAGAWRRFRHITLPMLRPYTGINLTIATLGAFGVFDLVYVMTQGGPVRATDVAMNQVYLQAFQFNRVGYAAAESAAILVITATLSALIMRHMNRSEVA